MSVMLTSPVHAQFGWDEWVGERRNSTQGILLRRTLWWWLDINVNNLVCKTTRTTTKVNTRRKHCMMAAWNQVKSPGKHKACARKGIANLYRSYD
jgi:hypothetical protein